jgi:hypothetical protein
MCQHRHRLLNIVMFTITFHSNSAYLRQKLISRPSLGIAIPPIYIKRYYDSIDSRSALQGSSKNDKDIKTILFSSSASDTETETGSQSSTNHNNFDLYSFLLLNMVAVIWGSQHVVIKSAVDTFPLTSLVNFWRFLMSSLLFSPALVQYLLSKPNLETRADQKQDGIVRAGMELGFYTFLGFAFQAVGLETTTASRSAFLLYLNVKFVPIISFLFFQKQYPISTWASALLAFLGTALLSTDGGSLPTIGDAWCIAAAGASAMFILRIGSFSNQFNAALLNSISFTTGNNIISGLKPDFLVSESVIVI